VVLELTAPVVLVEMEQLIQFLERLLPMLAVVEVVHLQPLAHQQAVLVVEVTVE
jgi:hypothetical protein